MTEAVTLLHDLDALDVRLMVQDGKLSADAPTGAITPDLAARIKAHKPELLALLAQPELKPAEALPELSATPDAPPEWLASQKIQALPCGKNPATPAALPESLARLCRAATGGHLSHTAVLDNLNPGLGGFVPDLGLYVLAWATSYVAGGDRAHCLARLEVARLYWGQA